MRFASVREAVAFYVSVGFRPMPMWGVVDGACACGALDCRAGKHAPDEVESTWKEGREFSPDDFGPHDNIAIALGPWGGSDDWLLCLDIDGDWPVYAFIADLPATLEQKSPRGRHLFYTVPAYAPLGNWVDIFQTKHSEGCALDLRYARGRVNVAPSRSAFGSYEWGEFREPARFPQNAIDGILDRRVERGLPVQWEWYRGDKRP